MSAAPGMVIMLLLALAISGGNAQHDQNGEANPAYRRQLQHS